MRTRVESEIKSLFKMRLEEGFAMAYKSLAGTGRMLICGYVYSDSNLMHDHNSNFDFNPDFNPSTNTYLRGGTY